MEAIWFAFLVILVATLPVQGQLKTGFYSSSCPRAEAIVRSTVEAHFNRDPTIAAGLLRLHFHDCFVQVVFLFLLASSSSSCLIYIYIYN
jgi:peroxidase